MPENISTNLGLLLITGENRTNASFHRLTVMLICFIHYQLEPGLVIPAQPLFSSRASDIASLHAIYNLEPKIPRQTLPAPTHRKKSRLGTAACSCWVKEFLVHRLEALSVDDRWSRLVVLLLRDPHLLEGRKRGQDGTTNPDRVLSLGRCDDLDLHRGWCKSSDFLLHTVRDTWVHGSTTRLENG